MRIFIFFCLLFCVACSQKKPEKTEAQAIRIGLSNEPPSLDPRKARDFVSSAILPLLFEGLPSLSEAVDLSPDGKTYTFHLRKTNWSDGTDVTAEDFASSWKSVLDPQYPTDLAYQLFLLRNGRAAKMKEVNLDEVGVRAQDLQTLVVELEYPVPYFLELLESPPFLPVSIRVSLQHPDWAKEAEHFVSNGPFQMKDWSHANQITFIKNPHYSKHADIRLEEVDFIIANADTALRMFEEKKLDWVGSPLGTLPIDAIAHLKQENQLQADSFLGTAFLRLNTEKAPLTSVSLRKALSLSIDRSAITEHILQGGQKPATHLIPPEMGLGLAQSEQEDFFHLLAQAKEELGGTIAPIIISYAQDERRAAIVQAIQNQWKEKLHLDVEMEAIESKTYFQKLSKGELQIALGSWTADFNDPINFLEVFKYRGNGTNNTGWENQQYIDLLNRSALCKDQEERNQLLQKAECLLMEEMPLIPLYHLTLNYLKRNDLKGVILSPMGHFDLKEARLEYPSLSKR